MPARRPAPTLRLRRLAAELRRLRAEAGLTREDVTERTSINEATLYRLETAKARPQARTLTALLDLYGATADQRAEPAAHRPPRVGRPPPPVRGAQLAPVVPVRATGAVPDLHQLRDRGPLAP